MPFIELDREWMENDRQNAAVCLDRRDIESAEFYLSCYQTALRDMLTDLGLIP